MSVGEPANVAACTPQVVTPALAAAAVARPPFSRVSADRLSRRPVARIGADGDVRVSGNGFDVRNAAIGPRPPAADAVEGRLMGPKTSWSNTKGEESGAGAVIIL